MEAILTVILGFTNISSDASIIAGKLIAHYGSIGATLAATTKSLEHILLRFPDAVTLLRNMHQAMVLALREPVQDGPVFSTSAALRNYLQLSLAYEAREIVRLLFLDSKNRLLIDELHSQGTVNHAPVYLREIMRRVCETRATGLIIVHNHPSGDPMPSTDDIEITRRLALALSAIGVVLQDSIVVGRHGLTSLRRLGLLEENHS